MLAFESPLRFSELATLAGGLDEVEDLAGDPHELRNLAGEAEPQDDVSRLRYEIISWCAENGDKAMLDGDFLKRSRVDDQAQCRFNPDAMGWRWY